MRPCGELPGGCAEPPETVDQELALRLPARPAPPSIQAGSWMERLGPARGIMLGLVLSAAAWAVIGLTARFMLGR